MFLTKRLVTAFLLFIIGFSLSACGKTPTEYTITFHTNGGSDIAPMTSNSTDIITITSIPTKEGFQFDGWYMDEDLTQPFGFKVIATNDFDLYAKWSLQVFQVSYQLDGGINTISNPRFFSFGTESIVLIDPIKEGYTFDGWYLDATYTNAFDSSNLPSEDILLYAKWTEIPTGDTALATETTGIHSNSYGNTNGNLNNQGLALYDTNLDLHYYSYGSGVYSYDPSTDETNLLFSLSTGGRATYMNLNYDELYYIDSSNGFLMSYDLVNHLFTTISDTGNFYASRTQNWVNFMYSGDVYGTIRNILIRYNTDNTTMYSPIYNIEQMNIDGTRVYYKPAGELQLYLMNYNGLGKSPVAYLEPLEVDTMHETLLLDVDYDYVSYYALILTVGDTKGLYTYNAVDGLVKIMEGDFHSVNYDGTYLYVVLGSGLYKVDLETNESELVMNLLGDAAYIQIINHWIYVGTYAQNTLYRINPVTEEIEYLN